MFAPLAYTIAIALAISLVLSLTLTPALATYLLKGGAEHDTRFIAFVKRPYLRLLNAALGNEKKTVLWRCAAFAGALALMPFLGTAFIPEMKEGSISPVHRPRAEHLARRVDQDGDGGHAAGAWRCRA